MHRRVANELVIYSFCRHYRGLNAEFLTIDTKQGRAVLAKQIKFILGKESFIKIIPLVIEPINNIIGKISNVTKLRNDTTRKSPKSIFITQ